MQLRKPKTVYKNVKKNGSNASLQYLQAQNNLLRDIMTLPPDTIIYKLTLSLAKQQKYEFRVALFLL